MLILARSKNFLAFFRETCNAHRKHSVFSFACFDKFVNIDDCARIDRV